MISLLNEGVHAVTVGMVSLWAPSHHLGAPSWFRRDLLSALSFSMLWVFFTRLLAAQCLGALERMSPWRVQEAVLGSPLGIVRLVDLAVAALQFFGRARPLVGSMPQSASAWFISSSVVGRVRQPLELAMPAPQQVARRSFLASGEPSRTRAHRHPPAGSPARQVVAEATGRFNADRCSMYVADHE